MVGKYIHSHVAATIALALIAVIAVVGGCTLSAPAVTSTTPVNNATNVPASPAVIQINFDQSMIRSEVQDAYSINPAVPGDPPAFAWAGDRSLTITYPQGFAPNTTYTVTLGTEAKGQNDVALGKPYVFSFTTGSVSTSGAGPGETTTPSALTFSKDIKPLADARCGGCHGPAMSDYDNIIAKKYVVPGNSGASPYYKKAAGLAEHPGGNVWKDKADTVKNWIDSGAAK